MMLEEYQKATFSFFHSLACALSFIPTYLSVCLILLFVVAIFFVDCCLLFVVVCCFLFLLLLHELSVAIKSQLRFGVCVWAERERESEGTVVNRNYTLLSNLRGLFCIMYVQVIDSI